MKTMLLSFCLLAALSLSATADVPAPWTNWSTAYPLSGSSGVPATIWTPFYGQFGGTTATHDYMWYNVPGSPGHKLYKDGAGNPVADDTNAYDINLSADRDQGLPVLAVDSGRVISHWVFTSGGPYGAVMVDHGYWCSCYLHMRGITVCTGAWVNRGQVLGYIGNVSPDIIPNHLHFVAYAKQKAMRNTGTQCVEYYYPVSRRVELKATDFSVSLVPQSGVPVTNASVAKGKSLQLTPWVSFDLGNSLNASKYFNNTLWSSASRGVATVDGNGRITGVTVGATTVKLKFSGKLISFGVTVTK